MIDAQKCLVVIPALNEALTVEKIVRAVIEKGHEVLVVDDGSTDLTAVTARSAGATVMRLPINLGVGGALRAGFRFAVSNGYTSVVQVDADGQHPVDQISDLLEAGKQHQAHLVIGSRYLSSVSTLRPSVPRRFSMWILSALASLQARMRLTDTTSGFRLISQPLLGEFAIEFPNYYLGDTYEATLAAIRGGYTVVEIPAALSPRLHGSSSVTSGHATRLIAKVLITTLTGLHPRIRPLHTDPKGA